MCIRDRFCTVDNSLVGTAGMKRKINVYKATAGTEKLKMGEGNTKSIEVSFTPEEYEIQLAQNKFQYYDEQEMTDPMLVPVGTRHMGTDTVSYTHLLPITKKKPPSSGTPVKASDTTRRLSFV